MLTPARRGVGGYAAIGAVFGGGSKTGVIAQMNSTFYKSALC